jgi:uncharacterized protein involved in exopolysaccharide biosynthesis
MGWWVHGLAVGAVGRHPRLFGSWLALLLTLTGVGAWVQPPRYEARVKLLIKRDRVDSVVTPTRESLAFRADVSQEEMQSEAQLLTSRDLLQEVAAACSLPPPRSVLARFGVAAVAAATPGAALERRVLDLERDLGVEQVKKSTVFAVTYAHAESAVAACVVKTIADGYVEKHLELQRPQGTLAFFQREVARHHHALATAEQNLSAFTRQTGSASVELERELKVRRQEDTEGRLRETHAAIAEASERRNMLEARLATAAARHTTEVRTADNAQLLERLRSTLLTLEMKRTELLTRYGPEYRLVVEVDTHIAQARAALMTAERQPLRDETTDNDPTHEWLRAELTRVDTDLGALRARATALDALLAMYRREAHELAAQAIRHQELLRDVKTCEDSYLLYLEKEDEARVSDALDRQRIANVVIAEPANVTETAPSLRGLVLAAGMPLSLLASVLLVAFADRRAEWNRP